MTLFKDLMKRQDNCELEAVGKNEDLLRINGKVLVYFDKQRNSLRYTRHDQKLKMKEIKLSGLKKEDMLSILKNLI